LGDEDADERIILLQVDPLLGNGGEINKHATAGTWK
jgi:hypothetical protein